MVLHGIIETQHYVRAAASAGLSEGERHEIVLWLAAFPEAGDLIVGTGGARKLRFAAKGKGKSGGVRVITYFGGADIPVFLLDVFSKAEKVNLTMAERNQLKVILGELTQSYRGGKTR